MVTSRAYLVGGMGVCFYLILLFNTNLPNQFYALSWLSVGVLVSSLGVAILSMLGLDCQWRLQNARVSEEIESWDSSHDHVGSGPVIQLQLGNAGSFNKTDLLFEIQLFCPRCEEHLARRFLIEALPASSSLTCDLPLAGLPRGRYRIEGVSIHGGDVLGLFRLRRRFPLATDGDVEDLIVGPAAVVPEAQTQGAGLGLLEGAVRAATGRGSGEDFRGTRHYVPGDDLRTVHWRSTARHGQLVVKEFHHQEQTQRFIIWDGAAGFAQGQGPHASTECALRLVASLSNALAVRGRRCSVLRLDSQPFYLPAPTGRSVNTAQFLDLLADADAQRESPLSAALGPYLRHLGAAQHVFLITQATSPEVLRAALSLRSRGAQVTVALVDAAAFIGDKELLENESNQASNDSSLYKNQVQLLQEAKVPVVLVPGDDEQEKNIAFDGKAQMAALRQAVRHLMTAQSSRKQPAPNASSVPDYTEITA